MVTVLNKLNHTSVFDTFYTILLDFLEHYNFVGFEVLTAVTTKNYILSI